MAPGNAAPHERMAAKCQNEQQYPCQNAPENKEEFMNKINGEPGRIRTCDQQLRRPLKNGPSQAPFSHVRVNPPHCNRWGISACQNAASTRSHTQAPRHG